jgi:Putative threonine/serine exporter
LNVSAASVLLPPLSVFLPGAAITVAIIELSAGDIVSGGSRLAFGAARLRLLVLGVVIAAETVGVDVLNSTRDIRKTRNHF